MKNFTKIALNLAGALACIGVVCLVIAFSMGLTEEKFEAMFNDGKFAIEINGMDISFFGNDVDFSSTDADEVQNEKLLDIEETCTKLNVEYGAGALEIRYEDVADVCVQQKNVADYKVTVGEDTLWVEGGINGNENEDSSLTIILPKEMQLEEVDLEIGAAQATIDGLIANEMNIAIGAGQAKLSNLVTNYLNLEVGAGEANVTNLTVEDLDVEAGMGEVVLEVNAAESDYNYSVECGIGNVQIGNNSYGGVGAKQSVKNPDASWSMDVECGIGEVRIKFIK